jgi:hypothetical protein
METTEIPTTRKAKYAISKGNLIGEGAFRNVYRTGKSQWVYKVDNGDWTADYHGTNSAEMTNYKKIRAMLTENGKVRVPEMRLIGKDIIAAEYVNGEFPAYCESYRCECKESELFDGRCWIDVVKQAVNRELFDIHAGNVKIAPDGTIYIIDLGC